MAIDFGVGLQLEDRGIRLVWNSSPDELSRLSRPDFCGPVGSAGSLTFAWNDCVFGLNCQVTAAFQAGQGGLCGLRLVFRYPEGIGSMSAGFEWLGLHLAEHFGPPLFNQEDGEQGVSRWMVGGVALRHEYFDGMGGGHYLFMFPENADAKPIVLADPAYRKNWNA
jgi:hypothetical protein